MEFSQNEIRSDLAKKQFTKLSIKIAKYTRLTKSHKLHKSIWFVDFELELEVLGNTNLKY